jgi:hypothetical protein
LQILTAKAAAGFSLQSGSLGSEYKDSAVSIKKEEAVNHNSFSDFACLHSALHLRHANFVILFAVIYPSASANPW